MNKQDKYFRLFVEKSYYSQKGIHHASKISYLDIYLNGKINAKGKDDQGEFEINGEFKNGYVTFDKHYFGKHIVYYIGKFHRNKLDLFSYLHPTEYYLAKENVDTSNLNAEIVFSTNHLAFPDYEKKLIFLLQENPVFKDELSGIILTQDGVFEINLKILDTSKESEDFSPSQKNCLLKIFDFEGQNEYTKKLLINQEENIVYRIEDFISST